MKSMESFTVGVRGAEQLPVSVATSSSVAMDFEWATVDLVLLDALEQFEDQATNRLPLSVLEDVKTQAQHNKTG